MSRSKPIKVTRGRKKNSAWGVIVLFVAAVGISLGIAAVWQVSAGEIPPPDTENQRGLAFPSQPSATPAPTPKPTPTPSPTPTPTPTPAKPVFAGAVPESAPVKSTYFDDAVFVGDSITEGMLIYGGLGKSTVLAGRGINFSTLDTAAVVLQSDGTKITIMDGLKKKQYGKVYLMLGGNEVANDETYFLKKYGKVIDTIRALQPDAIFYVQSMTPVTLKNNYNLDNARIDEYNTKVMELCKEKEVYFVNVAEALKDESGCLPTAASPADGMHFGTETFQKWFAYLKTHAVSMETDEPESSLATSEMNSSSETT